MLAYFKSVCLFWIIPPFGRKCCWILCILDQPRYLRHAHVAPSLARLESREIMHHYSDGAGTGCRATEKQCLMINHLLQTDQDHRVSAPSLRQTEDRAAGAVVLIILN